MADAVDEPLGSEQANGFFSAHEHAQQQIEPNKMIDMSVRDENLLDAVNLACRQSRDISEIKQDCVFLEDGFDVERGVAKPAIDQAWMQQRPHARFILLILLSLLNGAQQSLA